MYPRLLVASADHNKTVILHITIGSEFIGDLIFSSRSAEFDSSELLNINTQSKTFSLYYPKTRPGHDRYTIVASMNSHYDDWAKMDAEHYEQSKKEMIDSY